MARRTIAALRNSPQASGRGDHGGQGRHDAAKSMSHLTHKGISKPSSKCASAANAATSSDLDSLEEAHHKKQTINGSEGDATGAAEADAASPSTTSIDIEADIMSDDEWIGCMAYGRMTIAQSLRMRDACELEAENNMLQAENENLTLKLQVRMLSGTVKSHGYSYMSISPKVFLPIMLPLTFPCPNCAKCSTTN